MDREEGGFSFKIKEVVEVPLAPDLLLLNYWTNSDYRLGSTLMPRSAVSVAVLQNPDGFDVNYVPYQGAAGETMFHPTIVPRPI